MANDPLPEKAPVDYRLIDQLITSVRTSIETARYKTESTEIADAIAQHLVTSGLEMMCITGENWITVIGTHRMMGQRFQATIGDQRMCYLIYPLSDEELGTDTFTVLSPQNHANFYERAIIFGLCPRTPNFLSAPTSSHKPKHAAAGRNSLA